MSVPLQLLVVLLLSAVPVSAIESPVVDVEADILSKGGMLPLLLLPLPVLRLLDGGTDRRKEDGAGFFIKSGT